jgi:tRNA 2-selenouridine synthase SelU
MAQRATAGHLRKIFTKETAQFRHLSNKLGKENKKFYCCKGGRRLDSYEELLKEFGGKLARFFEEYVKGMQKPENLEYVQEELEDKEFQDLVKLLEELAEIEQNIE